MSKNEKATTFNEAHGKFMNEVNSFVEPQDELNMKLNELSAQLQEKTNKAHELTLQDPGADIESIYDDIKSLEKQISIITLKLSAFPKTIDRDLKSVLARAYDRDPEKGLIRNAQEVRDIGMKEMKDTQQKIDGLKMLVSEYQQKLCDNAGALYKLEKQKYAIANELFDLDIALPINLRKHPKPRPALSWQDCVPSSDEIGKHFETEFPQWKPVVEKDRE